MTCASVGLSGAVAASAASTKTTPATQAATPQGGGEQQKFIPFPRLDATDIVTDFTFTAGATTITPTITRTFTGSARRGHVFVNDGNAWTDLTPVFGNTGFFYDIALAPSTTTAVPAGATGVTLPGTGASAGRVRVTVRRADGAILRSDCTVSSLSGGGTLGTFLPLSTANCTAPTTL
ncbi:hypothetical protein OHB01_20120 [Microbispora hainanensis]|uniref:hypothetical protein n=1 Tax=Microbispora hainanensis TaxID=568844 RepID=UPI002E2BBDB6|nr:hypothetical protein [Microbispora hainanensis]